MSPGGFRQLVVRTECNCLIHKDKRRFTSVVAYKPAFGKFAPWACLNRGPNAMTPVRRLDSNLSLDFRLLSFFCACRAVLAPTALRSKVVGWRQRRASIAPDRTPRGLVGRRAPLLFRQ